LKNTGPQYPKDDITDRTGFLRRARLHQSKFRAEYLDLPYDQYGNYLTREAGEKGKNFYEGFGIFDAVKKYRKYNKPLYSNMLRSEHIPFNLFIPFRQDPVFCKNVFNSFLNNCINSIDRIEIEHAPKENGKIYLNDKTSFDGYIEYTHNDNTKGIIGIEVKYTEHEYKLKPNSKEEADCKNTDSRYYEVSRLSNLYKPEAIDILPSDTFRQVWRNHLLGESILLTDSDKFKHFTSLTLFPKGNTYFIETSKEYTELLQSNENKFLPVTYENFLSVYIKHCPDNDYKKWIDYLTMRYIVK